MMPIEYPPIEIDSNGTPYITGTRTKIEEVVLDQLAHSWDALEIHRQHPHLSLAEIHSALAYYYDHQEEIDAMIEDGLRHVLALQASMPPSSVRLKLKAMGLLP